MQADKTTLQDIGLFDTEGNQGLLTHLNFCKTNGGNEKLVHFLLTPLSSIQSIQQRQNAILQFMDEIEFLRGMTITNGSSLVIEKFFETSFKQIPRQINLPTAYWYQYVHAADYSLLRYSLEHLILFYQNLQQWVAIFETKTENQSIQLLVAQIKKYVPYPSLVSLPKKAKVEHPQQLLSLCYFFFYQYKNNTIQLLNYFYELDAYYSMAEAAIQYQFVFPNWVAEEKSFFEVEGAIHPLVKSPIQNAISLTQNSNLLFLTGANMAGKSTFIKTIGIILYLAHVGMGVPAKKISLSLFDGLITNLTIADNVVKGESYFFNEVQRVKNTIEKIMDGKKYFVLIDELFKGTNIQDAMKCSTVVIEGLQNLNTSLFVISTHLYEISEGLKKYSNIQFSYFETEVHHKELIFHYQLKEGVSQDRLGYLILEREGVVDLLDSLSKHKY